MAWSTALWFALLAGCGNPEVPAEPAVALTGSAEAEAIASAARSWRDKPGPELLEAVRHACERGLAVEHANADLDVALGDALANVLLRPDLGIPRLEPHVAAPDPSTRDAWLDALTRADARQRLATEHQRLEGQPLDVDHPAAVALASQAAHDPQVHWTDLRDAVLAARLVEDGVANSRIAVDRPLESTGAAFEALSILLEGWTLEVVTARTTLPEDPDPLLVRGAIPAADGKRRIVAFARGNEPIAVRAAGTALDLAAPPRTSLAAVRAWSRTGSTLFLATEGARRDGQLWLLTTNDVPRWVVWMEATERLLERRKAGEPEAVIADQLRRSYQQRLLRGD